jgi:hypothetical protein
MNSEPLEVHAYRPGKRAPIDWRTGTYRNYLRDMIAHAFSAELPDGPNAGEKPLQKLNTAENENFALGLLQCVAMIGEILSFYNERILNESFVGTAQERRSLIELVRLAGYQVRPGVSANMLLSIEPAERPGTTGDPVVPKGTRIQSIPEPGAVPQIFETTEDLSVRHEWTQATPNLKKEKPGIPKATQELMVAGTHTGLTAGDAVLLIPRKELIPNATLDPYPWKWFATLKEVVAVPEAGFTRLLLQDYPGDGAHPFDWKGGTFSIVAFRRTAALFGHNAPDWATLPDEVKIANGATVQGGIAFRDQPAIDGNSGIPLPKLNETPARAVVAASSGTFFAATASGVYRRSAGSASWEQSSDGLASPNVYSLAEAPDGALIAGGMGAVFRSGNEGQSWDFLNGPVQVNVTKHGKDQTTYTAALTAQLPPFAVQCLTADATTVYAGTEAGLFSSPRVGGGWAAVPLTDGEQPAITALFANSDGTLFAGTAKGVFAASGKSWISAAAGLPPPSSEPVVFAPGIVAAGSAVYSFSAGPAPSWTQLAVFPDRVEALARDSKGTIFAGTGKGLYRLDPGAATPTPDDPAPVKLLAVNSSDVIVAVRPYGGIRENEWPDFTWTADSGAKDLDIDATDGRIAPDSRVLLQQPVSGSSAALALFRAKDVSPVYVRRFLIAGEAIRISLEPEFSSTQSFPVRGTAVFFQSEELTEMETQVSAFPTSAASVLSKDGAVSLPIPESWQTAPAPGRTVAIAGELASAPGNTMVVKTIVLPSDPKGPVNLQYSGSQGEVGFKPDTVRLHANVIAATQGETVSDEIIGSGDASLAYQSFSLKRFPLAFVDPEGAGRERWTLSVAVDGVVWKRVRTFEGHLPGERIYLVALDDMGRATITFGDGVQGARLPSGTDNVRADYRVGDPGRPGVTAGGQVNLLDRPLGIRSVTSLTPSVAPHRPETNNEVIDRAARFRRSWDRPLSLRDYEDFATFQAGIGKALASRLSAGNRTGVYLTVASRYNPAPPVSESLLRETEMQIRACEVYPAVLAIENVRTVPFLVTAQVAPSPRGDWKTIEQSIEAALMKRFGFEARTIGQPVTLSEIIAVIAETQDVRGVRISRFQRRDGQPGAAAQSGTVPERLDPVPPAWKREAVRDVFSPAEIVYLADSGSLITERWTTAS